ncbi:MAG: zinc ABC transporter permease subunit ZnuB [Candidatus Competibacteraceae bacterium]|nr:zinc ABC transporter permease subunit ZnuB [Candidatus Competibacteraceae bacterium]MCP5127017.1 zinc ABC transporter permease subunit ZnuB [Gammaproteobacteria bacterium]HRX72104.1 zinc ABC transporter permease subunit ZnuB [Candidatus Competibacteraceae bacterium]
MDDFLMRALLGGLGVALAAGPLGAFIVWRRMAYFGDTLAHSGLLGVMLGIILNINPQLGVVATCLTVALALVLLQRQRWLAADTLLGILAHTSLSLGLVTLAFLETVRVDLVGYLFGDILAISPIDLYWIWGGALVALIALAWLWRPLLAATVHEELAQVEGVPVFAVRLAFMLLIAIVIAVAMKVVGILLITSLLIIPAAAARRFARSPESMALLASGLGCAAVGAGLWASLRWDTPAGPSVVIAAAALFALGHVIPNRSRH